MTNATVEVKKIAEESKKKWQELIKFCNDIRYLEARNMPIENGCPVTWGLIKRKYIRKKDNEQESHAGSESEVFARWGGFVKFCNGNTGVIGVLHVQNGLPVYAEATFRDHVK